MTTAAEIIRRLDLKRHPEGGHYRETWRADAPAGDRAAATAIYYLLRAGEVSQWHRVDADEIWLWHDGSALELSVSGDGHVVHSHRLGRELTAHERPQVVVPKLSWQSARSCGGWTLVSCVVAPAFMFAAFEMAPPGWQPGT